MRAGTGSAGSFIVRKDFTDDNSANVSVSLNCTSGTVTNSPQNASEAAPAVFYIEGQSPGTTCSASENGLPSGYNSNESDCQDGDPVDGSCTIVNTPVAGSDSFTVMKDFSDNNAASVNVQLTCTSGVIADNTLQASEDTPAVFTITGAQSGTTCTAIEPSVPSGYTRNQSGCQNRALNSSCTIINTLNTTPQEEEILYSDFEDGWSGGWPLTAGVSIEPDVAIGQYAMRLVDGGAVSGRDVSTAGYTGVTLSMRLAGPESGEERCLLCRVFSERQYGLGARGASR